VAEFATVVREVISPRPNIVAISADATLEQLRQMVITDSTRIPVYEQNIDQVIASPCARHVELKNRTGDHASRLSAPSGWSRKPSR
jgi:CBS domain containing-hemolysin-like protein